MEKSFLLQLVQKLPKYFLFGVVACCATMATATSIPNTSSNPKTFLGPTAHLSVTRAISDNTAFSVLGEGGPRNWRVGGSLAWEIDYYQRIKTSVEYLSQKITYSFFDGRTSPWVNQGALGVDYQYDFHEALPYSTQLDLAAYVSHAPSKTLGTDNGAYINNVGTLIPFSLARRIAGSSAAGLSPGVTFSPWYGTSTNVQLNYDDVRYDNKYRRSVTAKGLGGTVRIDQMIVEDVILGVSAAVRQPFNNYQADLSWGNIPYYGLWVFKIFGAYTIGKNSLPTTYNVGVGADYLIGADNRLPTAVDPSTYRTRSSSSAAAAIPVATNTTADPATTSSMRDFKGEAQRQYKDRVYKDVIIPPVEWEETDNVNKELLKWTTVPAIYMPQVLAIAEERFAVVPVFAVCVPPTVTRIPDVDTGAPFTYPLTTNFSGTNLVYTLNFNTGFNNGSLRISGSTLIGNGSLGGGGSPPFYNPIFGYSVTITATNACGSVTSNTFFVS